MTIGGTLPLRKPGTLICWAIFLYAASRLGLSSSKGTSTVSFARVGLRVSTALFTGVSPQLCPMCGAAAHTCVRCAPRDGPTDRPEPARDRREPCVCRRGDRTRTCGLLL